MRLIKFSKSSQDIESENLKRLKNKDQEIEISRKKQIAQNLKKFPIRKVCLLCQSELIGKEFFHRETKYIKCSECNHVQTEAKIQKSYPYKFMKGGFEIIYPNSNKDEFQSRVNRIYKPKFEWMLNSIKNFSNNKINPIHNSWLEIGCGAGYFLKTLVDHKVKKIKGLDNNESLVKFANKNCNKNLAIKDDDIFKAISEDNSEILVSFFVMEHLEDVSVLWEILKSKKKGTIFAFSVPTFGLSTLIEASFKDHLPRNLDNVIHTQLYTEKSINYALEKSEYEIIGEWIFGQDVQDLITLIMKNLEENYSEIKDEIFKNLLELIDPIQEIVDKSKMSDARHVIAVKK